MKPAFNDFLLAVQFLTRLPVGRWIAFRGPDLSASAIYFPLVGGLVGCVGALVYVWAGTSFPLPIAVILSMLAVVIVTGGLHEDGLADAADGLGGGATKERALEIMRDSRIGVYGALALWFALTMRFAAFSAMAYSPDAPLWKVMILAPAFSRCTALALLVTCDYVRSESATSGPFIKGIPMRALQMSGLILVALAVLFCGGAGLAVALLAASATYICRTYFIRRLGGVTGDCIGAAVQVTELAIYVGVCPFLIHNS